MVNDLNEETIKLVIDTVRDAMRNSGPTPFAGVMRIPEDDKLREMVEDVVEHKLAVFEKTVEKIIDDRTANVCRQLGLRIDDDHIVETRDAIGGLFKMQKSINRLAAGLGLTFLTGLFFGVLKLLGMNLPIGGEH